MRHRVHSVVSMGFDSASGAGAAAGSPSAAPSGAGAAEEASAPSGAGAGLLGSSLGGAGLGLERMGSAIDLIFCCETRRRGSVNRIALRSESRKEEKEEERKNKPEPLC